MNAPGRSCVMLAQQRRLHLTGLSGIQEAYLLTTGSIRELGSCCVLLLICDLSVARSSRKLEPYIAQGIQTQYNEGYLR